jgi:hypothetical protein
LAARRPDPDHHSAGAVFALTLTNKKLRQKARLLLEQADIEHGDNLMSLGTILIIILVIILLGGFSGFGGGPFYGTGYYGGGGLGLVIVILLILVLLGRI